MNFIKKKKITKITAKIWTHKKNCLCLLRGKKFSSFLPDRNASPEWNEAAIHTGSLWSHFLSWRIPVKTRVMQKL